MESMIHMNKLDGESYPKNSINHKEHPEHDSPGFLVRAVRQGYYGVAMREPGDVFKIQYARHFSDVNDDYLNGLGWMEKVDDKSSKRRAGSVDQSPRGAKPASRDPNGDLRAKAMEKVDQMTEESMAEDRARAEEADVI